MGEAGGSPEILEVNPNPEIIPNKKLTAPYVEAIKPEAKSKIHGHDRALDIVFDKINEQAIKLEFNESQTFKGVKFGSVHLSVTPELIKQINPEINLPQEPEIAEDSSESKPKHYVYFLQPAFNTNVNPYGVLDLGIDRFIREMPRIAGALRGGRKPPTIDIYLLGAPHGFGGKVTQEWIDAIKKDGFDPRGKLYAEFMQNHLSKDPEELKRTRIMMQGVSAGVATSAATSRNLPEYLKNWRTQRYYYGPVGIHERNRPSPIVKGANMLIGTGVELALHSLGGKIGTDITAKVLSQTETQFYKDMAEKFDLSADDAEQSKLKNSCVKSELCALIRGTPLDKSERTRVTAPKFDPLNTDIGNLSIVLENGLFLPRQEGKVSYFPTSRKLHFFAHKQSFHRWGEILRQAEGFKV